MPLDQFNGFARISIDIYCSTKQVCKGVDRHLQSATDVKNLLFLARLELLRTTGCVPHFFQYKEVTFVFSSKKLGLKFLIIRLLASVAYYSCIAQLNSLEIVLIDTLCEIQ